MSRDAGEMAGLVAELVGLEAPAAIDGFIAEHPELTNRAFVGRLAKELIREARSDLQRAERLRHVITRLAEASEDEYCVALSLKARGHMAYLAGRYDDAADLYGACQERFLAAGAEVEAAMNRCSSAYWTLALLGRYRQAADGLERARAVLEPHGDPLLLARLASNEANLAGRRDRHREAIAGFRQALEVFRRCGEDQDVVVALHNIAVTSIAIHDFATALASYRELKEHCARSGMELAAARADYNIAYLHYARGEYDRSLELYRLARRDSERLGDPYHCALCDLDQAEIYLELNLVDEAGRLAGRARDAFDELGNGYESAKATTFLAIAAERRNELQPALDLLADAQGRFEREGNRVWGAMVDFYRGLLSLRLDRLAEARALGGKAREFFVGVAWPARAALCDLLLAQVDLADNDAAAARRRCAEARRRIDGLDLPALDLKTCMVEARVLEEVGDREGARAGLRRAAGLLEDLRSRLRTEDLKIAFLEDKQQLYEGLVDMILDDDPSPEGLAEAFAYIESAKSRALADLLASHVTLLPGSSDDQVGLVDQIRAQRLQLNALYTELDRLRGLRAGVAEAVPAAPGGAGPEAGPERRRLEMEDLQAACRAGEDELRASLAELRSREPELAALYSATTVDLETVQAALPRESMLIEYFEARGVVYACLVDHRGLAVEAVTSSREVREHLRSFNFQISKHRVPKEIRESVGGSLELSMRACLGRLYEALVAPVADRLAARHLAVVPHGPLHLVPFPALHDGERFLVDRFSFSVAPSASVLATCSAKQAAGREPALVLGVADEQAPQIQAEIEAVGRALPGARCLAGPEATLEQLRRLGAGCRLLHIATHGFFRQDNPMFSGIQLADARLTLFDLYELRLGAEIVVLSGCATGLHVVEAGDELIGLTRGFLHAGAPSVLVTLWDVDDESTAEFMYRFYGLLGRGLDRAQAVATAMRELREQYPDPYHWAPFVLVGKPGGALLEPSTG